MAIDDAEKRRSAAHVGRPSVPGVTPNAAKDQEWRQQAGRSYSGILADSPVVPPAVTGKVLPLLVNIGKLTGR